MTQGSCKYRRDLQFWANSSFNLLTLKLPIAFRLDLSKKSPRHLISSSRPLDFEEFISLWDSFVSNYVESFILRFCFDLSLSIQWNKSFDIDMKVTPCYFILRSESPRETLSELILSFDRLYVQNKRSLIPKTDRSAVCWVFCPLKRMLNGKTTF